MKHVKTFLILMMTMPMMAFAGTPVEKQVPIDEVYAPLGFDSNDNSQIIVTGFLPNLCHKSPKTESEIKGKEIHINVTALKYHPTNPFCPEMIVPFVQSVNVGLLDKGDYKIVVNGKSPYEKESKIFIAESSSNAVDENIYANVHYIEKTEGDHKMKLVGYNPSDCLVLDEVKFISNKNNTMSVLPKMKKIRDFCPMKMTPFSYDIEVPKSLANPKILLHVRSMDGNSINSIFHQTFE
ncbi:MAG: hypothetical protein QF441_04920 [Bacteriovoracaceae bacterium]|jgi:hypothetical protein|nr:hypothetical protein [Halobacteriovoraceae bacterium]MDP7319925.1 hypothetical protein [Bacteriovoracaceae bacterium]|tara:strand:- start:382 stop:1095 length:714 start_codon:yes stop_codon:yes gene_type:complete